jgi:diguanylate cyclase (GGDEF)-like protein
MAGSLLTKATRLEAETVQEHCQRWVEVFSRCLSAGDPSELRTTAQETLDRAEEAGEDLHTWQIAVAVLRQGVLAAMDKTAGAEYRQMAEEYLQLVRVVVAEAAERQHRRSQLQANYVVNQLGWMISNLFAAREERQVFLALSHYLPAIGIRSARVALFEQRENDPVAAYRMLVPSEAPSALTDPTGDLCVLDRTRDFPPAAIYPINQRFQLSLLPVIVHDAAIGFAAIDSDQFENGASIVRELGAALERVRLHREVLELSLTDGLTGVHNRRYFDIFLQREVERSRRFGRGLELILVDLDNLKEYNDLLGHKYGDEALQLTANYITTSARRGSDCVVRFGGDEFAVVLPETNIEAARRMAEDIRCSIENQFLGGRHLTVSIGVVVSMKGKLSVTDLVYLADQALYAAKKGGRNQVCMAVEKM